MTKIVGFSAKKQGGKNTAVNHLVGLHMLALGIIRGHFLITEKGELFITDIDGDDNCEGIFDINRKNEVMKEFLDKRLNHYLRVYSFADLLKQGICIDVLGLSVDQCYGTDEAKNSLTNLKWEDMPVPSGTVMGKSGLMTARAVMQYVGTDIFRTMYGNVWVDSLLRKIQSDDAEMALISDIRFSNEVKGIQSIGGKVIKFTRAPFADTDQHESETALDGYEGFDKIIDNSDMIIPIQNDVVQGYLIEEGILAPIDITTKEVIE